MAEMRQTSVSPSVFPVLHQQFHMPLSKDYGKTQRNTQITDLSWFIIIFPHFKWPFPGSPRANNRCAVAPPVLPAPP
jgi:hypothetical protein